MADREAEPEQIWLIMNLRLLLITSILLFSPAGKSSIFYSEVKDFWEKFKRSVIAGDKHAVTPLSRFPIGNSYGKRSIKTLNE
jgi:hypothetical protein